MLGLAVFTAYLTVVVSLDETEKMSFVLQEAQKLISQYTDMILIDSKIFDGQLHLLVDHINHQFGDEFDSKMGDLASRGHISMRTAYSLGTRWPPDKTPVVDYSLQESDIEKKESPIFPEAKRAEPDLSKIKGERTLYGCSDQFCRKGIGLPDYLPSGKCFWLWRDDVQSYAVFNPSRYPMHIAFYDDRSCSPEQLIGYFWHTGLSVACYRIQTGNSIWWEWPGKPFPEPEPLHSPVPVIALSTD